MKTNKNYNFYAVDGSTGRKTKINANSVILELEDGQVFELAVYLSNVKLEASNQLSISGDTMCSAIIEDVKEVSHQSELHNLRYDQALKIMKKVYATDLSNIMTRFEFIGAYAKYEDMEGVVTHLAAKHNLTRYILEE